MSTSATTYKVVLSVAGTPAEAAEILKLRCQYRLQGKVYRRATVYDWPKTKKSKLDLTKQSIKEALLIKHGDDKAAARMLGMTLAKLHKLGKIEEQEEQG